MYFDDESDKADGGHPKYTRADCQTEIIISNFSFTTSSVEYFISIYFFDLYSVVNFQKFILIKKISAGGRDGRGTRSDRAP